MDILETNKKLWDEELKNGYGTDSFSEEDMIDWSKIIGHISNIEDMRVLDLGVGCGRSTEILLPLCKDYIGTDYSESGINHCKKRFKDGRFIVNDFTKGLPFSDNSFDFVIISFNGLDYCSVEERQGTLKELFRVSNKWICYSTHDLESILRKNKWTDNYIGLQDYNKRSELVKTNDYYFLEHYQEKFITYFEKTSYTKRYLEETFNPKQIIKITDMDETTLNFQTNYFLIETRN